MARPFSFAESCKTVEPPTRGLDTLSAVPLTRPYSILPLAYITTIAFTSVKEIATFKFVVRSEPPDYLSFAIVWLITSRQTRS